MQLQFRKHHLLGLRFLPNSLAFRQVLKFTPDRLPPYKSAMHRLDRPAWTLIFLSLALWPSQGHELSCARLGREFAPIDSPLYRRYSPDRVVDVQHMIIEVSPNFRERAVSGTTTVRFKPLRDGVSEIRLNAIDLRVTEARCGLPMEFQNTGEELVFTFAEPLPAAREQQLVISYSAHPRRGMYFRTRELGYSPGDEHLFTQGEDIEARHWFPCYDSPNDKFTSELVCHLPAEMTALSNGRLAGETPDGNGLKRVHWIQDKPITSYLVALAAGHFKKIEDTTHRVPLAFYTPASQIGLAQNSFRGTKDMMDFFEQEIGVPYPWDRYDQVCVEDFMFGGMENTTLTILTDNTLFPDEMENISSSQRLVAHELVHHWFGDLVTCEDWNDLWLNEGFTTYYEALYQRHKEGREEFLYVMHKEAAGFINRGVADDSRPVVRRDYDRAIEMVGYLIYPKGAWVMHMLRGELGEDLFRACIRAYLERHRFGAVETSDFAAIVEELSGRSFDQFFDQWIYHPHHPELQIRHGWDAQRKLAKISVAQVQQLTNGVALFRVPLTVRFKGGFGTVERKLDVQRKDESFFVPLPSEPKVVRIDPEGQLLAKISFEPPRDMLLAQLKDEDDLLGRLHAIAQLGKARDKAAVDLLSERLKNDPFYGARLEAAEALGKMRTKEALAGLLAAKDQRDARVRLMVAHQVSGYFEENALQFLLASLREEKNPAIQRVLLAGLNAWPAGSHRALLLEKIGSVSHENLVARGAIAAARAHNDPSYIQPILEALRKDLNRFGARGLAEAIDAVAYLGRHAEKKDEVYAVLAEYAAHPRQTVRSAAIRGLGVLRDERGLAILGKHAGGPDDSPDTRDAKRAIEAIQNYRPVVRELQTLQNEMLALKKQSEDFRKELDELKKQNAAVEKPPAKKTAKPARSKR